MTEAEAYIFFKSMTAYDQAPVLTDLELFTLFEACKVVDAYGVIPTSAGWSPTFNLNQGAYRAWKMKAGKAAGNYDFSAHGRSFSRAQVIKHCREMAAEYARGAGQTVTMNTRLYGVTPTNAG